LLGPDKFEKRINLYLGILAATLWGKVAFGSREEQICGFVSSKSGELAHRIRAILEEEEIPVCSSSSDADSLVATNFPTPSDLYCTGQTEMRWT